jgi:hypothetical protein
MAKSIGFIQKGSCPKINMDITEIGGLLELPPEEFFNQLYDRM